MMLHDFLTTFRTQLIERCRAKVARRSAPTPTALELEHGIPMFLDQLVATLRLDRTDEGAQLPAEIERTARQHGDDLLRRGFTVQQVVHDYGDLCQSVTELAAERHVSITVEEFRTFNGCLDQAIADAVTEFGRQRDEMISARNSQSTNERLGSLAHELRNLLNTAILAFEAIESGMLPARGATGAMLGRSLSSLRELIDRSLAEVRLGEGFVLDRRPMTLFPLLEEVHIAAAMDAKARGIAFTMEAIGADASIVADRQMLGSAIANLLQNAFKFSRPGGRVVLRARIVGNRVAIEVEDECGGLPPEIETLFEPFAQRGRDRTGIGLGLSISRRAVEANQGTLQVRNLPGKGCIFTIDLPRAGA